jgi:hypothetical protein
MITEHESQQVERANASGRQPVVFDHGSGDSSSRGAMREPWPALPLAQWRDTYATLHMWTQVVGKTSLALAPARNHWWQVAMRLTARGLATGPLPCDAGALDAEFDFVEHVLHLRTSGGAVQRIALRDRSVAAFFETYVKALEELGVRARIWPVPVEVERPVPFPDDRVHASYDPSHANRFWRVLLRVEDVFQRFRGRFLGKCSPVHFFWGSFDLAVTRFSGRRAPERPGADRTTREAYSHEVISAGFWPGSGTVQEAAFYSYAAPEPPGLGDARIEPPAARYDAGLGEFILPYDAVRTAPDPDATLLAFLQSGYAAAADRAGWDRPALEREP